MCYHLGMDPSTAPVASPVYSGGAATEEGEARRQIAVFEQFTDPVLIVGGRGKFLEANPAALSLYGFSITELRSMTPDNLCMVSAGGGAEGRARGIRKGGYETVHVCKRHLAIPVEVRVSAFEAAGHKLTLYVHRNIYSHVLDRQALERLTRLHAALRQVNQTAIKATDEKELFDCVCRALVVEGCFTMAWVARNDPFTNTDLPAGAFGDQRGRFGTFGKGMEGKGPIGRVIKEGVPVVLDNFLDTEGDAVWHEDMRRSGFSSGAFVPILQGGIVVACLAVYSAERSFFGPAETAILFDTAAEASYVLDHLVVVASRKRHEDRWRLLNAALVAATTPILISDTRGVIEWVNPAFTKATGYAFDEVSKKHTRMLKSGDNPPEIYADLWKTISSGKAWTGELYNRSKDGSVRLEEVTIAPIEGKGGGITHYVAIKLDIEDRRRAEEARSRLIAILESANILISQTDHEGRITYANPAVLRAVEIEEPSGAVGLPFKDFLTKESFEKLSSIGTPYATEHGSWEGVSEIVTKSGKTIMVAHTLLVGKGKDGSVTHSSSIMRDLTAKRAMDEQYLRSQRLESIGMLSTGIAHDLNNILSPVVMVSHMLREVARDQTEADMLDTLSQCGLRGAALVKQILGFAHGVTGEPRLLHVKYIYKDILKMISGTFPKNIFIESIFPGDLPAIMANPTQIHQVLLNLCVNARDAMPEGGTIKIRAESCVIKEGAVANNGGPKPGTWLLLQVEDSGPGIAPEVLARIWEPFFTTKGDDGGTGLGLSTVRGIIDAHEGCIVVDTAVGKGTTFKVYLPVRTDEAMPEVELIGDTPAGNGETILVVDDELAIRNGIKSILERAGYKTMLASDGLEAVSTFVSHSAEIALVIADQDLPHLDGTGFVRVVKKLRPNMPVLSISGATAKPSLLADAFLSKPFNAYALLNNIGGLLYPLKDE